MEQAADGDLVGVALPDAVERRNAERDRLAGHDLGRDVVDDAVAQVDGVIEAVNEHLCAVGVGGVFEGALPGEAAFGIFAERADRHFFIAAAERDIGAGVNVAGGKHDVVDGAEAVDDIGRDQRIHPPGFPFFAVRAELAPDHVNDIGAIRQRGKLLRIAEIAGQHRDAVVLQHFSGVGIGKA